MSRIGKIEKKTHNRFLNFYEFEAIHRDGKASPYYVSSRAGQISELKAVSHQNKPDGVILYGVYGEARDKVVLIPVSTTADSNGSVVKIVHDISIASMRLRGGTEYEIPIEVVTSKFKE